MLGNIKLQQHLNSHANFLNFPNAMLLLFRVATGDDWAGIMAVSRRVDWGGEVPWYLRSQQAATNGSVQCQSR